MRVSNKISDNQFLILKLLFIGRGLTAKQLATSMYGHVQNDAHVNRLIGNVYRTLKTLKNKGLINDLPIKNPTYTFYHLTEKGLQLIYKYLEIEYGYRGKGFNDDFGYFDYKVHEPKISPKKENNFHFYYQGWMLCLLMKMNNRAELLKELANIRSDKEKQLTYSDLLQSPTQLLRLTDIKNRVPKDNRPTNICSYRDNLHAAPQYKEKVKRFKRADEYCPDGEIHLATGETYFIEVDSGSEGTTRLYTKFNNLYKRLKALEEEKAPLPTGVIFVTYDVDSDEALFNVENKKKRAYDSRHSMTRYRTIYRQFAVKCKNRFGDKFEVLITPIEEFERYIPLLTEQEKKQAFTALQNSMKIYEKYVLPPDEKLKFYLMPEGWHIAIAKNRKPSPYTLIIGNTLYVLYHMEGLDALAWTEFKNIYKYMVETHLPKLQNPDWKVVPIVYYQHFFPAPPADEKTSIDDTRFHLETLIVDVGGSQPYWYDKDRDSINPPITQF